MRKLILSLAAVAATMGAAALMPSGAGAAAVTPAAMHPAIADSNIAEDVRWVRRCGHNWRNSRVRCWTVWRPGPRWHRRWHSRRWR
jgi:hypothetical protein